MPMLKKLMLKDEQEEQRDINNNPPQPAVINQATRTQPRQAKFDDTAPRPVVAAYYVSSSDDQQQHNYLSPTRKSRWVNIKQGDRATNFYYFYDDRTNNSLTPRRRINNLISSARTKRTKKKLSVKPVTIILAAVMVAMTLMGCAFMVVNTNSQQSSSPPPEQKDDREEASPWHPLFPHALGDHEQVHTVELPHHTHQSQAASVTVEMRPERISKFHKTSSQRQQRRRNQGTTTSDGSTLPDELPPGFITSPTLCPATHSLMSQSKILRSSYGNIFSITTPPNPDGSSRPTPDQLSTMSVDTITIQTLSLRMKDFRPELGANFEVWLYTGDQSDLNDNDLDSDPFNNNQIFPDRGPYQQFRAKFSEWTLLAIAPESELIPDTKFYDNNGHLYNIEPEGDGGTYLGNYKTFDHLEDVTIAAAAWNDPQLNPDGSMDATTQEGEFTEAYFLKIPESLFIPLLLPKYNGKLTLFVTLDRVGMQYGYAATDEFDQIDVSKHDYLDQVKSLDTLNGNVNLQMHVGEGVIMYPWLEEEFFYNTRRFLGKIWYLAQIPCEYSDLYDQYRETPMPSRHPTDKPTVSPSLSPSGNTTVLGAAMCSVILMKEDKEEPMSNATIEKFENVVDEFVGSALSAYCLRNEKVTVINQTISGLPPLGGETTTPAVAEARSGFGLTGTTLKGQPRRSRSLWQFLDPFVSIIGSGFQKTTKSTRRLQMSISKLEIDLLVEGIVNAESCPNRNETELTEIAVKAINNRSDEFVAELAATDEYFAAVFGVSMDNCAEEIIAAAAIEDDGPNKGAIIGGILAALILCCILCCLPLLIVRRRKRREVEERELIGDDLEWARPVHEDYFPPLGGVRGDRAGAGGDGDGTGDSFAPRSKVYDGEFDDGANDEGEGGLVPHSKLRPWEDESSMEYSHRFLDKDVSPTAGKSRPYGAPGGIPDEDYGHKPDGINIYPGGDIEVSDEDDDSLRLRGFEVESMLNEEGDEIYSDIIRENVISPPRPGEWNYEADGGINEFARSSQPTSSSQPGWNRFSGKSLTMGRSLRNLSINPQVLARIQNVKNKMKDLRAVDQKDPPPDVVVDDTVDLNPVEEPGPSSPSHDERQKFSPRREIDDRIAQLMNRLRGLEMARLGWSRSLGKLGESDYERWRRLQIGDDELSSSEDSSDSDIDLNAAKRRKKKKRKKGKDYIMNFDDLDAYNRALAVHADAYIHKWVRVKVEKDKMQNDVEVEGAPGDDFFDLGDLGGDDEPSTADGTLALGVLNDDDDTVDLGSIGGDDDSTVDLGTIGDESDLSSLASKSSLSLASRASSLVSRMSRKSKKGEEKSLSNLDPEEYENEINVQRAAKLSSIVRDKSLPKNEKVRRVNELNQWYADALQQKPNRRRSLVKEDEIGDLNSVNDDDTVDLGTIGSDNSTVDLGGDDSTLDLGTIGDESDLSSLASKSSLSLASRASTLVSRLSKKGDEKSLSNLGPEEYENEINVQRAAKLSSIVRDLSLSKDEKARQTDEVNKWYAAAQQRAPRRQTEYLGHLDIEDESSNNAQPQRLGIGARQATQFIGDLGEDGSGDKYGDASVARASKPPPQRPEIGSRQATQFIGDLGEDGSDDAPGDAPVTSKPPPKRPGLKARQATQFIGDLGDDGSDSEHGDALVASKSRPQRPGVGSRQATQFIGDLGEDGSGDEYGDAPVTSKPRPQRPEIGSRQATQFIGDLGEDGSDDDPGDAPVTSKSPPKRPGLKARQATQFIGDLGDDGSDSEHGDALVTSKPRPQRPEIGSRQATQFIGDLGDDGSDDDPGDAPVTSKSPPKRPGLKARQATQFIGDLGEDGSDSEHGDALVASKPRPQRPGIGSRQATEFIGDLGDDDPVDQFGTVPSPSSSSGEEKFAVSFSDPQSAQDFSLRRSSAVRFAQPKLDEDSSMKYLPSLGSSSRPSALRTSTSTQQSMEKREEEEKVGSPAKKLLLEKELSAQRSSKLSTIMRDRSLDKDERKRRLDEVKQWYSESLVAIATSSEPQSDAGVAAALVPRSASPTATTVAAQANPPAKPPLQRTVIEYLNTLESIEDLKEDLEDLPIPNLQRLASQLNIDRPEDKTRSQLEQLIAETAKSICNF